MLIDELRVAFSLESYIITHIMLLSLNLKSAACYLYFYKTLPVSVYVCLFVLYEYTPKLLDEIRIFGPKLLYVPGNVLVYLDFLIGVFIIR